MGEAGYSPSAASHSASHTVPVIETRIPPTYVTADPADVGDYDS